MKNTTPTPIFDEETMDNELYYQIIQDEKDLEKEQETLIREEELEYKNDYINSMIDELFQLVLIVVNNPLLKYIEDFIFITMNRPLETRRKSISKRKSSLLSKYSMTYNSFIRGFYNSIRNDSFYKEVIGELR